MKREDLRKILRGKCISYESCEAAIDELLNLHSVSGTVAEAIILLEYYENKCYENVMGRLVLINDEYLEQYNTYKKWLEKKKNDYS